MSRAVCYFRLQLKRFFHQAVAVLLLSALLIAVMGLVFFGIFSDSKTDEHNSLINIGIVGDEDDSYLSMAITGLRTMDSSRYSLDIRYVEDEKTAANLIRRGDLVAYIVIPEDFFDRAFYGDIQKVACVTASGATDFGTQITQELMMTITQLVDDSEKSVYGFQKAAIDSGVNVMSAYEMGTDVAFEDVNTILRRESMYTVKEIGSGGKSSVKDVFISGVLVLFLMLWGITCCTVFHARNGTLNEVLSAKGTGSVFQVVSEYGAYFVFMTATMSVFALLLLLASPLYAGAVNASGYHIGALLCGIILPIITISSMQFFLYELTDSLVPGVLLQFFCAIGMGYVCGCIYPAVMFPRAIQDAAAWLPAWNCRIWLDELLAGRATVGTFTALVAYFILFILLSAAVRTVRIRRRGGAA